MLDGGMSFGFCCGVWMALTRPGQCHGTRTCGRLSSSSTLCVNVLSADILSSSAPSWPVHRVSTICDVRYGALQGVRWVRTGCLLGVLRYVSTVFKRRLRLWHVRILGRPWLLWVVDAVDGRGED